MDRFTLEKPVLKLISDITLFSQHSGEKLVSQEFLNFSQSKENSITKLSIDFLRDIILEEMYLEIAFESIPSFWRGADYTWKPISTSYLTANYHSPKILKFEDKSFVAATTTSGCWEWNIKKQSLRWYLIHPDLNPTFFYDQEDKRSWTKESLIPKGTSFSLGIYEGVGPIPEIARSPIGFVPTVCFTDHCDFDTPRLLAAQRNFFRKTGIKTTKGFFLHTFSHQGDFAALDQEGMKDEFANWESDGHELAYHALSRSFREESWKEFDDFEMPNEFMTISTYIDHGYLNYNYTKQPEEKRIAWYRHMEGKGIKRIWNYLDVIEGNALLNNQLSPEDSSIKSIRKGAHFQSKNKLPVDRSRDTKTWMAYGTSENFDKGIKKFNTLLRKRKHYGVKKLLGAGFGLLPLIFEPEMWKRNLLEASKPFHFSRFSPIFFKGMNQSDTEISVFQTISVKDYVSVFSKPSLEKLNQQCGLLIAHTYFAFLGDNHPGRMFLNETGILNPLAEKSLTLLGTQIKEGKIWNPTLKDLHAFHQKLGELSFEVVNKQLKIVNPPAEVRYID